MLTPDPKPDRPSEPAHADTAVSGSARSREDIERLFRGQYQVLVGLLRARLHSQADAEEVANEAYAKLLGLGDTGAVSYLQAYLFRTALNIAANRIDQRVTRRRIDERILSEPEPARSPEHLVVAQQEIALLNRALAELPQECREVFVLVQFDDVPMSEVAERLGMSKSRVRRFMIRALEHCRKVIGEPGSPQGGGHR